jgi:hypothetical protein
MGLITGQSVRQEAPLHDIPYHASGTVAVRCDRLPIGLFEPFSGLF